MKHETKESLAALIMILLLAVGAWIFWFALGFALDKIFGVI